ncbi:hypothetical protein HYT84_03830 [Candidatus Micrarchaeota archaeon]|nr:hypothetical protein [Candidatus Micrarchaeota archaeon]
MMMEIITPTRGLILDGDGTIVNGRTPISPCLPDALRQVAQRASLFMASTQGDNMGGILFDAGIDPGLFKEPTSDRMPSAIFGLLLKIHGGNLDAERGDLKADATYRVLRTLGYTDEDIVRAIKGELRIKDVLSVGNDHTDEGAARAFGLRYLDTERLTPRSRLSVVLKAIDGQNRMESRKVQPPSRVIYEPPKWSATGKSSRAYRDGPHISGSRIIR